MRFVLLSCPKMVLNMYKLLFPELFARHAIHSVPTPIVNLLVQKSVQSIYNKHPQITDRLSTISGKCFLIKITDLQYYISFIFREHGIRTTVYKNRPAYVDVYIAGALSDLLDLLGGDVDGDTMFFSRHLTIEGDTESLLTLRNAIDSEDFNIKDELFKLLGPFNKQAQKAFSIFYTLLNKIRQKYST